MPYIPFNYKAINIAAGTTNPSQVKSYNNRTFAFWERALFQRAVSVINFENLPPEWSGNVKDFFYYCLFKFGFVGVFSTPENGLIFQPGTLRGVNIWYGPTNMLVTNPALKRSYDLTIGSDVEIIKLTPDYMGVWDIITKTAERLSNMDNAIDMSITNSKLAYIIGARNKPAAEAIKKIFDKIHRGESTVVYDQKLLNDSTDKAEPWQFLERANLKQSYITTDLLNDFNLVLAMFDKEIGIPTLAYEKKERMNTAEAEQHNTDGVARVTVWLETLEGSLDVVNKHFGTNIKASLRNEIDEGTKEGDNNEFD